MIFWIKIAANHYKTVMPCPSKGQLISKCLFGVFNFFQKMNENKLTWGIIVVKSNSFVRFLEETSAWKNYFEFVWPLITIFKNEIQCQLCLFSWSMSWKNMIQIGMEKLAGKKWILDQKEFQQNIKEAQTLWEHKIRRGKNCKPMQKKSNQILWYVFKIPQNV